MNLEIARRVLTLLEAGEHLALATTVQTQGSSPRHAGSFMLVRNDGSILGTIGGGPLEALAIEKARRVLETRRSHLMDYELTNADSAGLGMICGGRGVTLIEYLDPALPAQRELYRALLDLLASGCRGWLVTSFLGEGDGEAIVGKSLVDSSGVVTGDPVCSLESLQELARKGGTFDGVIAGNPSRIFVQPVGDRGTVYVFGAGHCGQSLVPVLSMVGFRTVVIDDRADFANSERFPNAGSIRVPDSLEHALEGYPLDEQSYIVIMTRGHLHDRAVLAQALRTKAGYIGMIGSRTKVATTFRALQEEGFSSEDLARVHAPIGLSIGAETPEEIAVSIAAELIQVRRARGT